MRERSFKIPILGQVENSEEPKVREGSLKIPILGQVENSEGPKVREGSLKIPILELTTGTAGTTGAAEVVSKTLGRNPTDGSYTTPSNYFFWN